LTRCVASDAVGLLAFGDDWGASRTGYSKWIQWIDGFTRASHILENSRRELIVPASRLRYKGCHAKSLVAIAPEASYPEIACYL